MPSVEQLGPIYSQPTPSGLVRLQAHLLDRFPGTTAGGMYNPVSSLSGGGPSPHRVTSALDLMCDRVTAGRIMNYMVSIAEMVNLQQCIAWHEIISAARWGEGIRWYAPGDHSDGNGHAHIAVGLDASRRFDAAWVGPPPPQLTAEQIAAFFRRLEELDVEHGMAADTVIKPGTGVPGRPPVGYTLDRWGGVNAFGGAVTVLASGYWPGLDVARRLIVTDWAKGYGYVQDLHGPIHPFGPSKTDRPPSAVGVPNWKSGPMIPFAEV